MTGFTDKVKQTLHLGGHHGAATTTPVHDTTTTTATHEQGIGAKAKAAVTHPVQAVKNSLGNDRTTAADTTATGVTRGPVVGTHSAATATHAAPVTTPVAASAAPVATATTTAPAARNVCKTEHYTVVEDRPVTKEVVTLVKEHHPVEREMVVEHRVTGKEREVAGTHQLDHLGTTERVVEAAQPKKCP